MSLDAELRLDRQGFSLEVRFSLPSRGICALIGPSGSGKTSLLRAIAGLEPARGRLRFGEETWLDSARGLTLPAHRRPVGLVFQHAALFPDRSVRANLDYGYRRRKPEARRIALDTVIEGLSLTPLLERYPGKLSGGERQRVAIGRALLASPRLLLLDEPVSALDRPARDAILEQLEALQARLDLPMLYVSHAGDEVARLADHALLLDQGRIRASGPLSRLMADLDSPLAQAEDAGVVLDTRILGHDEAWHLTRVGFPGGELAISRLARPVGARVRLRLHARDISLSLSRAEDSSILNILPCRVDALAPEPGTGPADSGAQISVGLVCGETPLLARITRLSAKRLGLTPGLAVFAQIKSVAVIA